MYDFEPKTPGGKSTEFFPSLRLHLKSKKDKGVDPEEVLITVEVKKNKVGRPFKKAEYKFNFVNGEVDPVTDTLNIITDDFYGSLTGVEKRGAWIVLPQEWFPDIEKFHGAAAVAEALASDLDNLERIRADILTRAFTPK